MENLSNILIFLIIWALTRSTKAGTSFVRNSLESCLSLERVDLMSVSSAGHCTIECVGHPDCQAIAVNLMSDPGDKVKCELYGATEVAQITLPSEMQHCFVKANLKASTSATTASTQATTADQITTKIPTTTSIPSSTEEVTTTQTTDQLTTIEPTTKSSMTSTSTTISPSTVVTTEQTTTEPSTTSSPSTTQVSTTTNPTTTTQLPTTTKNCPNNPLYDIDAQRQSCININYRLFMVKDTSQNDNLKKWVNSCQKCIFLGLRRKTDGTWYWEYDNTDLNYNHWKVTPSAAHNYAAADVSTPDLLWIPFTDHNLMCDNYCEAPPSG